MILRRTSRATSALLVLGQLLMGRVALCDPTVTSWSQAVNKAVIDSKLHTNFGTRLQAAMFTAQWQAVNDVLKGKGLNPASKDLSAVQPALQAAVASAGKAVLMSLLPNANVSISKLYNDQITRLDAEPKEGVDAGTKAADIIVKARASDGANPPPPENKGSNDTGKWRPTPPHFHPMASPQWADMKPWALTSPSQFRMAGPPALNSDIFKQSYDEVMVLGNRTSTNRTATQNEAALFYNGDIQVVLSQILDQVTSNMSLVDSLRLYTAAAVAAADTRIAAWNNKLFYNAWRPVTAIPLGNGGNFTKDPFWTPAHHTSPTPEYPASTVATAEAIFSVLRNLGVPDAVNMTLKSPSKPNMSLPITSIGFVNSAISYSRVWGGGHFRHTLAPSGKLGRQVAKVALDLVDKGHQHTALRK